MGYSSICYYYFLQNLSYILKPQPCNYVLFTMIFLYKYAFKSKKELNINYLPYVKDRENNLISQTFYMLLILLYFSCLLQLNNGILFFKGVNYPKQI